MLRRWGTILTVIAAIVVFAAAVYVATKNDPVKGAGSTPGLSSGRTSTAGSSTSPTGPASAATRVSKRTVIAFLGDDYTAGQGASSDDKRFTTLLATSLGAVEKNFGVDGAGYAKPGTGGKTYADEVDEVVAAHPDVVVVSGGRNDVSDDLNSTNSDAQHLFQRLSSKLPNARLIAVAPFWGDSNYPPELRAIATSVQKAVHATGGTYVSLPDPLHNHPDFMADDADPDDAGYAAIASALSPKLTGLLSAADAG